MYWTREHVDFFFVHFGEAGNSLLTVALISSELIEDL
jgi:hypothetical protein